MNNKTCWCCKTEKPLDSFTRDRSRSSGINPRCKNCDRLYRRDKRERNPVTYKEIDRRYYEKNREKKLLYQKEWRLSNVDKHKAHSAVKKAMKDEKLQRLPCSICGSLNSEAHHKDYSKPLEVTWLCRTHHMREHYG